MMMFTIESKSQLIGMLLVLLIIAVISPFFALIISLFFCFTRKDYNSILSLIVFLSLYLSVINTTKLPEGDQSSYMLEYLSVSHYSIGQIISGFDPSFSIYLDKLEYGWVLLNIIGYYLSLGCYPLFVFLLSEVIYLLLFSAMFRFISHTEIENKNLVIITGIIIIGFFPQLFTQTMHLERQCAASSLFIFALVDYIVEQKPRLWLLILPASIHTSQFLLIGIVLTHYLKFLYQRYNDYSLVRFSITLLLFGGFMTLVSAIAGFLVLQGASSYNVERLTQLGSSMEGELNMRFALTIMVPMVVIIVYRLVICYNRLAPYEPKMYLVYGCLVMVTMFVPDNLLRYRFFNMSYMYMPFVVPLFLGSVRNIHRYYLTVVSVFFLFFFFFNLDKSPFNYASVSDVIMSDLISLLTYRS